MDKKKMQAEKIKNFLDTYEDYHVNTRPLFNANYWGPGYFQIYADKGRLAEVGTYATIINYISIKEKT